MAKVIKKFPWSPNGYDVEMLHPGDERDFRSSTAALAAAGLIEAGVDPDQPAGDETGAIQPVTFPPVVVAQPESKPAPKSKRR